MQTKITNEMPFLKPGTHAAGYPFRADAALANAEITFGTPVVVDSTVNPMNTTGTDADGHAILKQPSIAAYAVKPAENATFVGLAVAPDEHVIWKLPDDQAVYSVKKGETIGVARKGAWAIALPVDAETKETAEGTGIITVEVNPLLAIGNKVYVNATGKIVLASANATELGEIRDFRIDEHTVLAEDKKSVVSEAKGGVVVVLK